MTSDVVERAEAVLALLESDFGQSGEDVRFEILRCEFDADEKRIQRLEGMLDTIADPSASFPLPPNASKELPLVDAMRAYAASWRNND